MTLTCLNTFTNFLEIIGYDIFFVRICKVLLPLDIHLFINIIYLL